MRIRVQSQSVFVLCKVIELMCQQQEQQEQQEGRSPRYSSSIELGLTALVREQMRQCARQGTESSRVESRGLEGAIETTAARVQERMSEVGLTEAEIDLEPYWASVKRRLRYPAREISQLSVQLRQARQAERLGSQQERVSLNQIPYKLSEIGLQNAVEGLVVTPSIEEVGLDLETVVEQQNYTLVGEWFPFLIVIDTTWQVVVDDDATLFINSAQLPGFLAVEAREIITKLADEIYTNFRNLPYQG